VQDARKRRGAFEPHHFCRGFQGEECKPQVGKMRSKPVAVISCHRDRTRTSRDDGWRPSSGGRLLTRTASAWSWGGRRGRQDRGARSDGRRREPRAFPDSLRGALFVAVILGENKSSVHDFIRHLHAIVFSHCIMGEQYTAFHRSRRAEMRRNYWPSLM
jgi:hypothetical protein